MFYGDEKCRCLDSVAVAACRPRELSTNHLYLTLYSYVVETSGLHLSVKVNANVYVDLYSASS